LIEAAEADWNHELRRWSAVDSARLVRANIKLSKNKKVIGFMQKKTEGKTPKSKSRNPDPKRRRSLGFAKLISLPSFLCHSA
jgi:hypothetical protein